MNLNKQTERRKDKKLKRQKRGYEWLWVVMGGYEWLWVVTGGYGW